MKKLLCVLMATMMVMALATTAFAADYKIAIVTGTTTQGEEEFRAAEKLAALYPDIVLTATYPDAFAAEIETTKATLTNFAFDPDVKAIIMCQAVPGMAAAYAAIREMRPDILLIGAVPQEAPATATPVADILLQANDPQQGVQIVDTLKNWGVEVFVHYSFPRHMAMESIVFRHGIIKDLCAEAGIEFVDRTAPDPTSEAGMPGAQQFILTDVPEVMNEYAGKKVGFFTTNCGMQEPLQAAIFAQENAYYPMPCCPSPYHAFPASMSIAVTDEIKGNPVAMLEAIADVLKTNNGLGRFSTWASPLNMVFIDALFAYATGYINGDFTEANDPDALYAAVCGAIGADFVSFENYTDMEGKTYDNLYLIALPSVDFNDYAK